MQLKRKRGEMKDTSFLEQTTKALEDFEAELEKYYKLGDTENFNKTKKEMMKIQGKILEEANDI